MSGGIDSSMAALLLKDQGYDVVGVTFKMDKNSTCCDIEAVGHAKEVCRLHGIPHYVVNVIDEFSKKVIGYFIEELSAGRTPNPCVFCNRFLKFDELFKFAKSVGAEAVATGHYAKISLNKKSGLYELRKGRDVTKDQSYYLSFLPQKWLSKIIFPVGRILKSDVYKMARAKGLDFLVNKKQSQDLCFVSEKFRKYFIAERIPHKNGDFVDEHGNVLGKHNGVHFYTLGQRKGIEIPNGPYFVVDIKPKLNQVIVSKNPSTEGMFKNIVKLKKVNFTSGIAPKKNLEVMAKIRYQQKESKALLKVLKRGKSFNYSLVFKKPQRAVTSGQIAVFYKGVVCLGGGYIK